MSANRRKQPSIVPRVPNAVVPAQTTSRNTRVQLSNDVLFRFQAIHIGLKFWVVILLAQVPDATE